VHNSTKNESNCAEYLQINQTTTTSPTVFIILPCYNEEKNIETLIKSIEENCSTIPYKIIAVDDGSKDKTGIILNKLRKRLPITVVKHQHNKGLHAALKSGLIEAVRMAKPWDFIVTMDSDLTHDPKYISNMLSKISGAFDIVVASRYVDSAKQKGVPLHRRILSRGVSYVGKLVFKLPIKDVTSGFRCYKAEIIAKIMERYGQSFIEAEGFEVSFELLVKAQKIGAKITEIPFFLDYSKKKGASKLKIKRTIYNYLKLLRKLY
jgi:dolichol-phosphate mannosyltransferase